MSPKKHWQTPIDCCVAPFVPRTGASSANFSTPTQVDKSRPTPATNTDARDHRINNDLNSWSQATPAFDKPDVCEERMLIIGLEYRIDSTRLQICVVQYRNLYRRRRQQHRQHQPHSNNDDNNNENTPAKRRQSFWFKAHQHPHLSRRHRCR